MLILYVPGSISGALTILLYLNPKDKQVDYLIVARFLLAAKCEVQNLIHKVCPHRTQSSKEAEDLLQPCDTQVLYRKCKHKGESWQNGCQIINPCDQKLSIYTQINGIEC